MKTPVRGIADLPDASGARQSKCRTRTSCDHHGPTEPSGHPGCLFADCESLHIMCWWAQSPRCLGSSRFQVTRKRTPRTRYVGVGGGAKLRPIRWWTHQQQRLAVYRYVSAADAFAVRSPVTRQHDRRSRRTAVRWRLHTFGEWSRSARYGRLVRAGAFNSLGRPCNLSAEGAAYEDRRVF